MVNDRHDKWILLNKSWIVQEGEGLNDIIVQWFRFYAGDKNYQFPKVMKLQRIQQLSSQVSLFFLKVKLAKPFPKNFYKFEKHETGWRFLINLHNNNRFASRKKLSRKQQVAQFCNQFMKLMVTSSKLKKIKFLILWPLFIPRA